MIRNKQALFIRINITQYHKIIYVDTLIILIQSIFILKTNCASYTFISELSFLSLHRKLSFRIGISASGTQLPIDNGLICPQAVFLSSRVRRFDCPSLYILNEQFFPNVTWQDGSNYSRVWLHTRLIKHAISNASWKRRVPDHISIYFS